MGGAVGEAVSEWYADRSRAASRNCSWGEWEGTRGGVLGQGNVVGGEEASIGDVCIRGDWVLCRLVVSFYHLPNPLKKVSVRAYDNSQTLLCQTPPPPSSNVPRNLNSTYPGPIPPRTALASSLLPLTLPVQASLASTHKLNSLPLPIS